MTLINKQLDLATKDKFAEFDEICSLTNPTVKKALLKSFADDCDSAAVHLQAAALPRQKYQVIIHDTSWNSLETAKAYLAAQKAAGTPVQIAYQLATPEVYATDPVDFDNAAGAAHRLDRRRTGSRIQKRGQSGRVSY